VGGCDVGKMVVGNKVGEKKDFSKIGNFELFCGLKASGEAASVSFSSINYCIMKTSVIGPIVALVIGGAVGFIAGKIGGPEASVKKETVSDSRSSWRGGVRSSQRDAAKSPVRSGRVKSLEQAMSLPGQNSRLQALMDYYAGLSISQFEEEAAKLEDLPWSERIMVGHLLFSRWGEEDPTAAMAYTQTMGFAGMFVRGTVMRSWAAKFPEEAAQYYTEHPADFRMGGMMGRRGRGGSTAGTIATEWARQDSAAALTWAQSLDGRDLTSAVKGVFEESAKTDPEKAAEMLTSLTDDESKKGAQNAVAREWGKQNWSEAQAWIATLPADAQAGAMSQALRGLAETDPVTAAENVTSIAEGEDRDRAMEGVAKQWGRVDPESAAAWLMDSGSETAQSESIGKVVSSWVRQDSVAALSFINEQPEGGVRDQAASSYVMANQTGKVEDNLALAETIGDERTRERAVGMTVAGWMRQDPEAAKSYLDSTEALSERSKKRISHWIR
jgi:hypothetical protein